MQKLAVALVGLILAAPVYAEWPTFFVGPSASASNGDMGSFSGAYSLCQDTYGSGARMCTTEEYLNSPTITVEPNEVMWARAILDTVGGHVVDLPTSARIYQDKTINANCAGWTMTHTYRGKIVNSGSTDAVCSDSLRVACCKTLYTSEQ